MKSKVLSIISRVEGLNFQEYANNITRQRHAAGASAAYWSLREELKKIVEEASSQFPTSNFGKIFQECTQELDNPNSHRITEPKFRELKDKLVSLLKSINNSIDMISTSSYPSVNTQSETISVEAESMQVGCDTKVRLFISHLKEDNIFDDIKLILDRLNGIQNQIEFEYIPNEHSSDLTDLMERISLIKSCKAAVVCLPSKGKSLSPSVYVDLVTSLNVFSLSSIVVIYDGNLPKELEGLNSIDSISKFLITDYDIGLSKGFDLAEVVKKLVV